MTDEAEYILGTDHDEASRLRFQHEAWVRHAHALWERAGLRAGDVVIDLGCGPGYTSFDLARVVGPEGPISLVTSPRLSKVHGAQAELRHS